MCSRVRLGMAQGLWVRVLRKRGAPLGCGRNDGITTQFSQGKPICVQRAEVPGKYAFTECEISTCPSHWTVAKLVLSFLLISASRVKETGKARHLCFQLI